MGNGINKLCHSSRRGLESVQEPGCDIFLLLRIHLFFGTSKCTKYVYKIYKYFSKLKFHKQNFMLKK